MTVTEQAPCLTGDLRTPGKRRAPQRHRMALAAAAEGSMPSPNYSSRNGTTVTGIAIHSAEGPLTAVALGDYFGEASSQVSSHVGIDDTQRIDYVDPKFEAWTLRNGNPWTENAEMCAFAAWTRAQWLAHPDMLRNTAEWVAERCKARGIPPNRITADDIRAGRRSGYFAHWDYTRGTGDGTHWDVGSNFPWDVFDGLVQAAYNGSTEDDFMSALTDAEQRRLLGNTDKLASLVTPAVGRIELGVWKLSQEQGAQQDPKALAEAIVAALPADEAKQVADELAKRLAS